MVSASVVHGNASAPLLIADWLLNASAGSSFKFSYLYGETDSVRDEDDAF